MTAWVIGAAALVLGAEAQDTGAMKPGMAMPATGGAPACPAAPAPAPAEFDGWATTVPLVAGTSAEAAPALPTGTAASVTLADAAAVRYAVAPDHVPPPGSHGGSLALTVATAGRYRVGLGAGAWIDLVQGGAALRSVAHGHGPACSTLRKTVDFDLRPGRYLLQLSGNAAPTLAVMVVRLAPR